MNPILKVTAQAVAIPLRKPIITPVGAFDRQYIVLASVETNDFTGTYYGWIISEGEARALREMVVHLGRGLIGKDAGAVRTLHKQMLSALRMTGRSGIGLFAVGILDACLWDIKGKEAGLPIWRLLGGAQPREIASYASSLFLSSTIEELKEEAREMREAGFKWVKMRVGAPNLDDDLRRIDAVRSVLGDDVNLMMDAVMLWDVRTALRRIHAYMKFNPYWVEDPVDYREGNHLAALAAVRAESPVRIAAGEFCLGPEPFRAMMDMKAVDILMVDLEHVGGLSPWLDVLGMARVAGAEMVPHVFVDMSLHVHCIEGSSLPVEYVPWTRDIFADFAEPLDGNLQAPTAPGLGFTFDRRRLSQWGLGGVQSTEN